ncbi:MAG: MBL fold metallo-hydrolase [Deltaproteobacteria bacterium]|nr:MBL fold metallo-hydrolase [Deltaproteobacteria bacterium]MBI2974658.1 MBL fold metallo-hydrolase [Deltaproteobacteria bacterium]
MIHWFGHASFLFNGSKIIYTDPWELKKFEPKADIILITHEHYDHCSPNDVAKLSKPETIVIAPEDCAAKLKAKNIKTLKPGESTTIDGIKVETVLAYNLNKPFHKKSNNWIGYIFTLDGQRIYQAGDTDAIPEMKQIKADVVLVPIGGTYTMTAKEAAEAVSWIKPKIAIPMHWGKIVGNIEDAETFKKLVKCEVQILKAE